MAAGSTITEDGRLMSINVEDVGGLVIQHYVAEIHEPHHCQMVSLSEVQTPFGWVKNHVIWDLLIEPVDERRSRLVNSVFAWPTRGTADLLSTKGATRETAGTELQAAVTGHNGRETPLFAQSMAR